MKESRNYADECGDHGGTNRRGEPCGRPAGWGVDADSGKCRQHCGTSPDGSSHEGNQNAVGNDGGAPEGNQNAQTHALFSDHDGYFHDLDEPEQEWVFDFTNDLLDRYRTVHGKDPDMFDKESLKNIAIDFHRVATANSWFSEHGLVTVDFEDTPETTRKTTKVNVWAQEIRQYNESVYRRMQKHGLLDDPESQKAQSLEQVGDALMENLKANYQ